MSRHTTAHVSMYRLWEDQYFSYNPEGVYWSLFVSRKFSIYQSLFLVNLLFNFGV